MSDVPFTAKSGAMSSPLPLSCSPLTRAEFSPFGDAITPPLAATGSRVNEGTAQRENYVAQLENLRPHAAALNVVYFRCAPRPMPFTIVTLEKHPYSAQLFVPMNAARYLIVVAEDCAGVPDLRTLKAFLAASNHGFAYRPNIWHHTLIALDQVTDFTGFIWEDGTENDCITHELAANEHRVIAFRLGES